MVKRRGWGAGLCGLAVLSVAIMASAQQVTTPAAAVAAMSLDEKVAQLQSGAPAIPRLGIHAYDWWSEGLHGTARNGFGTVFPQAIGLAASWDPALLQQVGTVVSTEARAKFNAIGAGHDHPRYMGLTIWSPNINIFRDPRWGRGQETYGEDPYLTGQLAIGFVRGIQGDDPQHPRAIATPKHFAVHSGPEAGRHGFDIDVSPHDLEATYLPAFRAVVTQAQPGSVMCAYNALHGTPVCADADLLQSHLRDAWGFKGFVVSDCDAIDDMTHFHYFAPDNAGSAAAAIKAGTDLDCGDAYAGLGDAVRRGLVDQATLDKSLQRLFAARQRVGEWQPQGQDPYAAIGMDQVDSPAHQQLALRAALESIVLLKNAEQTLPLHAGMRIAVIGPNADAVETLEANYHGTASAPVTPLEGLRARFGVDNVTYAQGAPIAAGVPLSIPETALRSDDGQPGLHADYFANDSLSGKPVLSRTDRHIDFDWDDVPPAKGLPVEHYSVRWSGQWLPPAAGDYLLAVHVDRCFDCAGHDPVRLYVDGRKVLDASSDDQLMQWPLHVDDARPHALRLEYLHTGQDQGVRLQWLAPSVAQQQQALAAVRKADAVIAFVGLSPDVEGEELKIDVPGFNGGDRTDIGLPAAQSALLMQAKASGKPLIVVLLSGGAVALDWAQQHADAVLTAWYPGQAGGTAIAQVLSGDYNPAGRLPVTFYRNTADLPPFTSYDMKGRTYRYFTGTPLYPFGYGLSYSHFNYSNLSLAEQHLKAGESLSVDASVRNDSHIDGDEVVQLYLDAPGQALAPQHALVAFARVHLRAGEKQRVHFQLDPRSLSEVDALGARAIRAGDYKLYVGGGQPGFSDGVSGAFQIIGRQVLPR